MRKQNNIKHRKKISGKFSGHGIKNVREYVYLVHLTIANQMPKIASIRKLGWTKVQKLNWIHRNQEIPVILRRKVGDARILPVMINGIERMVLTDARVRKPQTTQGAMEGSMIGISLRDRVRYAEIRRRTKVTDIMEILKQKVGLIGHAPKKSPDHKASRLIGRRSRTSKIMVR